MLATPLSSCANMLVLVMYDVVNGFMCQRPNITIRYLQVNEAEVYKTSAPLVNPFLYLRLTDHSYVALTQENQTAHHCINVSLKMVSP